MSVRTSNACGAACPGLLGRWVRTTVSTVGNFKGDTRKSHSLQVAWGSTDSMIDAANPFFGGSV